MQGFRPDSNKTFCEGCPVNSDLTLNGTCECKEQYFLVEASLLPVLMDFYEGQDNMDFGVVSTFDAGKIGACVSCPIGAMCDRTGVTRGELCFSLFYHLCLQHLCLQHAFDIHAFIYNETKPKLQTTLSPRKVGKIRKKTWCFSDALSRRPARLHYPDSVARGIQDLCAPPANQAIAAAPCSFVKSVQSKPACPWLG